jgi:hypothetical protein
MRKRTLLIISLILVSAACAGPKPKAVITESCVGVDVICRVYDPKTGLVTKTVFGKDRNQGIPTDRFFKICDGEVDDKGERVSPNTECRQVISSSGSFGFYNPDYDCGGWGCSFWP